jgi:tricorn protease
LATAAIPGRFMQYPGIHGDKIVFTYEGDLWTVGAQGGTAARLTSHPGSEYAARFSPDGQQIAFSASYDSGTHVYVMPADGGVPKRLTWQHNGAQALGWTPDGRVVFRAAPENTYRPIPKLFTVSAKGEMPLPLPVPNGVLCSFSPDGKKMAYCPRGNEEYYWKRYKGGQYQEIWQYDFEGNKFKRLTDYVGKNSYPMWVGDKLYFVSDRDKNGIANIFSLSGDKAKAVTHYDDFDVQMASTDGHRIVYLHSGYLWVLDVASGETREVNVQIPTDQWKLADRTINPRDYIQHMSVANDAKSALFEARGDVYKVPADDVLPTENLTGTAGTRERFPQISPDGKSVAFFSDKTGEYELYVKGVESQGEWVRLTEGLNKSVYRLEWSPDGAKILFSDKSFALYYVEVAAKKLVKIDTSNRLKNDEFTWEVSDYTWSPDGNWIAYTFVQENRNSQVFLYNLSHAKIYPLTTDFYDNLYPSFDANGDYLYYCSYRNFEVQMDVFEDNHIIPNPVQIMAVQLKAGQRPPFEKVAKDEKKEDKTATDAPFRIDLEGIQNRVYPLPVKAGNFYYAKAGKGKVTWASIDSIGEDEFEEMYKPGGSEKWDLHIFDMASRKEIVVDGKVSDWRMSANREQMILRKSRDYFITSADKAYSSKSPGDKLSLDKMVYVVQCKEEWNQIFTDTWRWYRDFFYDPAMHGRDWNKIGESYRAYIQQLPSRASLNWVLSQMVGELCVSHTYVGGGDMGPALNAENPVFTGLLGVDLAADESGYYKLAVIYGPTDFNRSLSAPLARPDFAVKAGDYLIAIDGHEIKVPENPYRYLQVTSGQKVKITVNDRPEPAGAKSAQVEPIRSENELRYNRWVADNIDKVLTASDGDIGYVHLTAMSSRNVAQFDKFWRAFKFKKGLIIDVRGNGGGWTEYFIIDKLERKQVAYNVMQGMKPYRYPNSASQAQYAVISNEANGSDGEAFIEDFRANKLGKVIGVPSWGGLVGIMNQQKTLDNGSVQQPNNAFWGRKGKWLIENHGADPDIFLPNDPAAVMQGRDPQLEKAIEVVKGQIKDKPWDFPKQPAYPKK